MNRHSLFTISTIAIILAAFAFLSAPAHAADAITVTSSTFTNNFPTQLVFQLEAQSNAKITQAALLVQVVQCVSSRYIPTFSPDTKISATYKWDLGQNYLPPGTVGQYWWVLQDGAGNQLETPKQSFTVEDPNHTWQKLSNNQLALYWYSGGQDFGQALFNRGVQAISFLQQNIGVTLDQQVRMHIYASHGDLMKALSVGAQEWTGGQDFPEYSVVLIGVPTSELDWGLGATAHELTHQVVHHAIQNGCSSLGSLSLPPLMDEGLAVYNQDPGKPDPQFTGPLSQAIASNTLIPLHQLLSEFPADPNAANLSYGESWSFVDFLMRHYGQAKMGDFLKAVKAGGTIDDLFMKVYGLNLTGLEQEWRKDIGAQALVVPTVNSSTPTPFPTYGLSTADTPVPNSGAATATAPAVAVNATPAPPAAGAPSSPASPVSNLCGGVFGFIALGIFGAAWWQRKGRRRLGD